MGDFAGCSRFVFPHGALFSVVTLEPAGEPGRASALWVTRTNGAADDFRALRARVEQAGLSTFTMKESFGARGSAPETFYFHDPDHNVLEVRHYG